MNLLISVTGGRFPRAVREPPRSLCSLWGLTWTAYPAGVAVTAITKINSIIITSIAMMWYRAKYQRLSQGISKSETVETPQKRNETKAKNNHVLWQPLREQDPIVQKSLGTCPRKA